MGRRSGAQNHKSQEPASDLSRPSRTIAASAFRCGRTLLGLLAALSAGLPTVFAAVTVVVLVSLFPATVEGQGDSEPCPGGGYNPTPTAVEVTAVPIVVESTTADYFVLYVSHEVDEDTTVDIPVLVKSEAKRARPRWPRTWRRCPRSATGWRSTLSPTPADVDGDCIDDITELADPVGMNPVNPAAAIALSDGAVAIPDRETFETLAETGRYMKFAVFGLDTDRPRVYFINTNTHTYHGGFQQALTALGIEESSTGDRFNGLLTFHPELHSADGRPGLYSILDYPFPLRR